MCDSLPRQFGDIASETQVLSAEISARPQSIVFLHGFAQSAHTWDEVVALLSDVRKPHSEPLLDSASAGDSVLSDDLYMGETSRQDSSLPLMHDAQLDVRCHEFAGHGGAGCPSDAAAYELDALVAAFFVALEGCPEPATVVGYSMGGRVALSALVARPHEFADKVGALVLESAGLGPATEQERRMLTERNGAWATDLRRVGVEAFMDEWERLPLFATQTELPFAVREQLRAGRLANDAEALARTLESSGQHCMPARSETMRALGQFTQAGGRVLYVAGERDRKYACLAADLHATVPAIATRIVAGAGHNVHLEAPAAFAAAVQCCFE